MESAVIPTGVRPISGRSQPEILRRSTSGLFCTALNGTLFGETTVLFQMFGTGVVLFAIAIIVGLFGFGVISDEAPFAAKLWSVFFLLLAVVAFGWTWVNHSRQAGRPDHKKSQG